MTAKSAIGPKGLTDINDRGKVGRPSNGRGRSPRLYEGN